MVAVRARFMTDFGSGLDVAERFRGLHADVEVLVILGCFLAERVEPWMATQGAMFLHDFPASQSALAQVREEDPPVAERFELYIGGVELCNGYHEITDADELRVRMERQAALRVREGLSALPTHSHLEIAMRRGYPASAGVALGYDRLLMWLWECERIDEVIAFPWERA